MMTQKAPRKLAWLVALACVITCNGCDKNPTRQPGNLRANDDNDAGDDDGGTISANTTAAGTKDSGASVATPAPISCQAAMPGTSCGQDKHCVHEHCVVNTCGDGVLAGAEECDDGNLVAGDGCDPICRKEEPLCGDGHLDQGEECDDGNKINEDACSNACTKNVCGNNRIDLREECDDGNMVDGDACSNACTKNVCGNGRLDTGEACDDGNKNDNDGCTNQCMIARCGNGAKEGAEECDDGNMVDDDGCSNMCTANVCGNMRIDPGEVCDGDTVGIMCASCKTKTDVCRPCEEQNCTNYMNLNLDLVAACYNNPDPSFVQKCSDAVACAREKNCAYTPRGAEQCYCGDATTSQCAAGMGINGPCKAEFEAAAGSPDYAVVTKNFGTRRLPIGSAVFMLQCDQASCADVCTPKP